MKKKILFVIDSLHSGGAEKSLVSLLSLLDYERFEIDLLLFNKSGLYIPLVPKDVKILEVPEYFAYKRSLKEKVNFKFEYVRLKNSLLLRSFKYKNKYHTAQITSKNILSCLDKIDKNYDVAIAYSQGLPTYYVSEKTSANKKMCWINTDYKKAGYNSDFDKKYYEKYDYIVAVSQKNREALEAVYPIFKYKMRVIYDIISPKLVRQMADEGEGYMDGFDGIRILTIGRHVDLKGYDMAIDAAKILKKDGIKFRWYSIGEGILTNKLQKQVKDNGLEDDFIFLGTYTNPYPFIKQCNIYCQPSRFEGFGMAIAEAKILKKLVISTNFEIIYDQIENMKNGLIVNMNSKDIADGIKNIIRNKKLVINIKKNIKSEYINIEDKIESINKLLYEY